MKAKAKISGMLTKFHAIKCKTSLKLVISRIKLLKNKRETQIRQMRRELAQLLETGQDQTAIIRVEHVIREEKTMTAYDLIEVYCELIAARLPIIESQKICPIDLKEAISSVIFAGPRCADLTELIEIRKQFTAKYGREFITAAIEVRPDCGVSRLIVEKLSVRAPDAETKIKVLAEIAKEHNIEWEPKAFEEKMQGTKDDLLDGPTSFASADNARMSSGFSPLPSHYLNNDSNINMPKNNVSIDKSNVMFPNTNIEGHSSAVHPEASEKVDNEVKHAYSRQDNGSSNQSDWNMEFKDAASAAQAAAVSAERASMAARAAAELASRGIMSRQHSAESYVSPTYVSSPKLESASVIGSTNVQVDSRRGSMLRQHSAESSESASHVSDSRLESTPVLGSMNVQVDSRRGMHDAKQKIENVQRDSGIQSSAISVAKSLSRKDSDTGSAASARSHSSGSVKSVTPDGVHQEPDTDSYVHHQGNSSSSQSASKLYKDETDEEEDEVLHKLAKRNVQPAYSAFPIQYDDYSWDDHENTRKVDSSDVVFDSYESDSNAKNIFNTFDLDNSHHTSLQQKQTHSFLSDVSSPRRQKSGSMFTESSSQTNPVKGNYYMDYEEAIPKADFHSPSDDNFQPTYDSDDHESGNEDEIEKLKQTKATKESTFLYKENSSRHDLWASSTSFDGKKAVEEDKPSAHLSVHPDDDDEMKLEKSWRKPGMSVRNNQSGISMRSSQPTPIKVSSSRDVDESARNLTDKGSAPSVSNEEDEFSGSLNLGLLRGGLKHRNFKRPSYVTDPIIDENSKQIPSGTSDSITSPRVKREESSNEDSMPKVSSSKSRASKSYSVNKVEDQTPPRSRINPLPTFRGLSISSNSDEEEQSPVIRVAERGNKNPPLSRKTKVVPSDARRDTLSRPVGGTSPRKENKSREATEITENRGSDYMSNSSHYQAKMGKPDIESSPVSPKPVHNETRQPATSDNGGSSSRNPISHENSQKNPSHVHHKLPDYDTLHSYFSSLRSNVRPK